MRPWKDVINCNASYDVAIVYPPISYLLTIGFYIYTKTRIMLIQKTSSQSLHWEMVLHSTRAEMKSLLLIDNSLT